MFYLLFLDWLRGNIVWFVLVLLLLIEGVMIHAPRLSGKVVRILVQSAGAVLLLITLPIFLLFIFFAAHDQPVERFEFFSPSGRRAALLRHDETRDSAHTRVTVSRGPCCEAYVAYEYYGDGEDLVDSSSIRWIDEHTLAVRYTLDPTGTQDCKARAGDVRVVCQAKP